MSISIARIPLCMYIYIYIYHMYLFIQGFPGSTSGKELACQCRSRKRRRFDS